MACAARTNGREGPSVSGVRRRGPGLLLVGAVAVLASLLLAWDGMLTMSFTDYENEAEPSFMALRAGHLGAFLAHLPAYGGSLVLRGPFALLPSLWGGGDLAVFRAVAIPCLLAGIALGMHLWISLTGAGRGRAAASLALALCVFNPLTLRALESGHPEELLGAALCAGAVLAALADHPRLAGLLLGIAVANKAWALLAVGPVLLSLPRHWRQTLVITVGVAGLVLAPVLGAPLLNRGAGHLNGLPITSAQAGAIFQPWQIWWFLGDHGHVVHGLYAIKTGYRAPPSWISAVPHPLIAVMPIPLCLLWLRRRAPDRARGDTLLLLALVMTLRCLLDTWDTLYYALPLVLALVSWEAVIGQRAPWLGLMVTLALWSTFELIPRVASADVQSALYLAWVLPLVAGLAVRVYAPQRCKRLTAPLGALARRRLPTLARTLRAGGTPAHSSVQMSGRPR